MSEYLRAALREKISTFHQLPNELFWQAWQRFDGYRRTRPHHGYSDVELLQFFYYGVRRYFQVELDVAGFWDLCAEYTQGAYSLCDNMAFSSHDNPMAELEAQIYYLKEEANKRKDVGFNTVEQEQINRSSFQESIYCGPYYYQEQAPPPQYQKPTPQPSKSQTTLHEIRELFSNGILECTKIMEEIKEVTVTTKETFDSKLITSDTPLRMVGNQVDEEVGVTESQQGTLPMCTVAEEETERIESELAVFEAEFAEEINLQTLTEHAELEEEVGAAESKEVMIVEAIQPPPVVEEKAIRKCGSTLRNQLTKMFGDSRRYELSVTFEKTTFVSSYCDSGSNLSWMTYATARSLGFTFNHFQETQLSLEFADQPEIVALGVLQDLAVTINNLPVRADFAVVALGEEFDDTLILGEPFVWVARALLDVHEEMTNLHLGDNTTTQEETEMRVNELETVGAESADEIDLLPTSECFCSVKMGVEAVLSKEMTPGFVEEPPPVAIIQTTLVVQEEVTTLDEDKLQSQEVQELEDAPRFEVCVKTENFLLADTEDISLTMESQAGHGFCAEDILESAAMPRKGPDKPEDNKVSQFDKIAHHDIEDSLARIWSMSKKGNGFPWDDGISRELELVDDPRLDNMNLCVSNLLEPYLLDQNKSRFLIGDAGKTAGIPRTGPDIPSFNEFDQSQFLRFAGEGGCITYCDIIGSVTRPPEILLNVPVLC